jgi:PAS domain S-box-containing protein
VVWDRTNRPAWLRYAVGILAAVISAVIRLQFLEILELRVPFVIFFPAVGVAALYGGFGAGLLATLVSAALADYFWIPPVGRFAIANFADQISIVVFFACGVLISYLAEAAYRAQARAHKAEEQSKLSAEREKAAVDLQQSESKYRELVQNANSAIIRWKRDGTIAFFNEYAQKFFGYSAEEVVGKKVSIIVPDRESTGADLTGLVQDVLNHPERYTNNINENILRNGRRVWMAWTNRPIYDPGGEVLEILAVGIDITERKRMEMERETTVEFLHFVNQSSGTTDLVRSAATFFQRQSGCEAVGIRLKEAEDYPYREVRGFSRQFIEMENYLCARDDAGNIVRDITGDPYIECMCGNVICGRVDPSKPFFSPGGSFWANSTTRLLASTTDAERQTRTRNRCNGEGYESVALIPLSFGAERIGLLQMNDRREGMFQPEFIAQCERLAGYLAVGLAKSRADEKIHRQTEILETINLIFHKSLTSETEEQLGIACLRAAQHLTQSKFGFIDEIGPDNVLHCIAFSDPVMEHLTMPETSAHRKCGLDIQGFHGRMLLDGRSVLTNDPQSCSDSISTSPDYPPLTAFLGVPLIYNGKTFGIMGLANREGGYAKEQLLSVEAIAPAIVEALMRRRAEATLSQSQARFKLLSETSSRLLASEDPQAIVEELCRKVMQHLDCHTFFNFLVDDKAGRLHLNACAGIPEETARKIEWLDYGAAVCGCVALDGERIVAENIFNTPDIRTDLIKSFGVRAYACHPLDVQGKTIGTLSFGAKTMDHFTVEDLALMKTVADQVAIAMEKLRLVEELRISRDRLELRVRERTAELDSYMAKLEQSNQALKDFAHIAAHDMHEPLRKVASFGNLLMQKHGDSLGQSGTDYLNRMLHATKRMQSLLASLLEYSKVTINPEPFREIDLTAIVREVLSDLEVRIAMTGGEVHVENLPVISADPTQIRQLFQNLIGNALKFHKPGEKPKVNVRFLPSGDSVCRIIVEDNGIGFEEEHLEKIFAPFQRLRGRGEYEGTGMGLAICRKIVERHGGTITAKSAPGEGASFIVRLPLRPSMEA